MIGREVGGTRARKFELVREDIELSKSVWNVGELIWEALQIAMESGFPDIRAAELSRIFLESGGDHGAWMGFDFSQIVYEFSFVTVHFSILAFYPLHIDINWSRSRRNSDTGL